jgi:hypothetical protein
MKLFNPVFFFIEVFLPVPIQEGRRSCIKVIHFVSFMSLIMKYSGTCLIRHTKGPGKCVGLYRMSEYPGVVLVTRNTLEPNIFVGCHRMSEISGVGLHKFHCTIKYSDILYNPTHFPGPLVCRIRQVPLYIK